MTKSPAPLGHTGGHWHRKVLGLAVPIILSNMTVPLVGIVDTAVMGRMAEPRFMGAAAIGAIIFSSVFWLFGFLRMGTGGLVAQAFGAADEMSNESATEAQNSHNRITRTAPRKSVSSELDNEIYRALLIAVALSLLILLLNQPILHLALKAFTASTELKQLVRDYYNIRIIAAPATLAGYVVMGALIGVQHMRAILLLQLVLNGINILLTVIFFQWFEWGIKGVATATVIAEYLALIVGLVLLHSRTVLWPLSVHWAELVAPAPMRRLLEVNSNLFIRTLCLTLAFYWLTQSGARLGELTLAANAILIHMVHFMAHALDGFAHSAETLCGYYYGQKKRLEFLKAARISALWGVLFAILFSLAYGVFGLWIVEQMTTIPAVQQHAAQWLGWIAITPLFAVWGFLLDGIYIGTTHTRDMRNGMIISLIIFIASNLALVHYWGNSGLWASYFVLMATRSITLGLTWPRILQKLPQ